MCGSSYVHATEGLTVLLCSINGCYKCTLRYYCGFFSQSYWFPVKTCTQWLHSRGSGDGVAWNCIQKKKKKFTCQMLIFLHNGLCLTCTYLVLISLKCCYSNLQTCTLKEKDNVQCQSTQQWIKQICLFYAYWANAPFGYEIFIKNIQKAELSQYLCHRKMPNN